MKIKDKYEFVSKYWICEDCAFKKRYEIPPNSVCTVIHGLCGHCKETAPKTLTPVTDYKRGSLPPIFD